MTTTVRNHTTVKHSAQASFLFSSIKFLGCVLRTLTAGQRNTAHAYLTSLRRTRAAGIFILLARATVSSRVEAFSDSIIFDYFSLVPSLTLTTFLIGCMGHLAIAE